MPFRDAATRTIEPHRPAVRNESLCPERGARRASSRIKSKEDTMFRKLVAIGALGLIIAISACEPNPRNPDDRVAAGLTID